MSVKDAVVLRFQNICAERGITPNQMSSLAGVTASSVYSMMEPSRRNISIVLIKKLCDGLEISLAEFFSGPEFSFGARDLLILHKKQAAHFTCAAICVGITYFCGPSPGNYRRRK